VRVFHDNRGAVFVVGGGDGVFGLEGSNSMGVWGVFGILHFVQDDSGEPTTARVSTGSLRSSRWGFE
jgi:hypothetical protein